MFPLYFLYHHLRAVCILCFRSIFCIIICVLCAFCLCFRQAIAAEAAAVAAEDEARRLGGPPPSLRKQLATYLVTRSGKCTAVLVK